jgi:hypothetical protein
MFIGIASTLEKRNYEYESRPPNSESMNMNHLLQGHPEPWTPNPGFGSQTHGNGHVDFGTTGQAQKFPNAHPVQALHRTRMKTLRR